MKKLRGCVDGSAFNDPVALNTKWTSMTHSSVTIQTHRIENIRKDRIDFRPTVLGLVASLSAALIFGLAGLYLLLGPMAAIYIYGESFQSMLLVPMGLGICGLWGGRQLFRYSQPLTFDKTSGFYYRGWFPAKTATHSSNRSLRLSDIYALQLLAISRDDIDGFEVNLFEVNLILRDSRRVNIFSEIQSGDLHEACHRLDTFLNIPIWEATEL